MARTAVFWCSFGTSIQPSYQIGSDFGCLLLARIISFLLSGPYTSPRFSPGCVRMCSTFNYPAQICVHISVWFSPWSFLIVRISIQFSRCPNDAFRPCHAIANITSKHSAVQCGRESLIEYVLFLWMQSATPGPSPTSFIFDSINGHLRRIEKLTSGMGKLQFVMFSLWILISYLYSCAHHSLVIPICR